MKTQEIIENSKDDSMNIMAEEYNFPKKFEGLYGFFAAFFSDIIGLEVGFKPASIFNIKKCELNRIVSFFKNNDYSYEVSDFAFDISQHKVNIIYENFEDSSTLALYVSKYSTICKELKKLDSITHFPNSSLKENTINIQKRFGELLGYPTCCIDFYCNIHTNPKYNEDLKKIENDFDYESLYRYIAKMKSKRINYLLNNFNSTIPQIYSFSVCDYNCQNAKNFVLKVIDYINQNKISYRLIEKGLRSSILSFSIHDCIVFSMTTRVKDKVYYPKFKCSNPSKDFYIKFCMGDSFKILDKSIEIFKEEICVGKIERVNEFNGLFVQFEH